MQTDLQELQLAWRRYRRDIDGRCFVDHPSLTEWIEADLDAWLSDLRDRLEAGYNPQTARRCVVPKARFMIRPGTVLDPTDAVVYAFLVGRAYAAIHADVKKTEGKIDIAYRTKTDPTTAEWTQHDFTIWRDWRTKSIAALRRGITHVVVTDITGFYDNIPIPKLMAELRRLQVDEEVLALLQECLRKWSHPRDEGIPQGYSASDLLAKLYLRPFDRKLAKDGYRHLRYVDDIRIFCSTLLEAKKAIEELTKSLFIRGLTPQSGKTKILARSEARHEFDGVTEIIKELDARLTEELLEAAQGADYLSPGQIVAALAESEHPPTVVLERAFEEYFGLGTNQPFQSSLFHYLLVRLGKVQSRIAIPYCLDALRGRPEETAHVLTYFGEAGLEPDQERQMVSYVASEDAIYDHQIFQILRWCLDQQVSHPELLEQARGWSRDRNRDPWLRSYALAYIGKHGDSDDLDEIEEAYPESTSEIERGDRIAAVKRMERGRRNAFYSRVASDGEIPRRAVLVAKRGRVR